MTFARIATLGVAAVTVSTSACSSSASQPAGSPAASTSATSCPTDTAADAWPAITPQGLPVPPGLNVIDTTVNGASHQIRFTTAQSIKQASAFLAQSLPAAGFTLHGGDSEEAEVDQPFTGKGQRASVRLHAKGPCLLEGVLVLTPSG